MNFLPSNPGQCIRFKHSRTQCIISHTNSNVFHSISPTPSTTCVRSYLVRPSPFSAQKTFERHNSRRKSNISFCSNMNMAAAAAAAAAASASVGSRRGSGFNLSGSGGVGGVGGGPGSAGLAGYGSGRRAVAALINTKSNSLSLPDSPNLVGQQRARSNSLRVTSMRSRLAAVSV